MFLFLLLVCPVLLVILCSLNYSVKECIIPSVLGIFAGIITCLFNAFFEFSSSYYNFSFLENFIRILLSNEVLPLLITGIVFFLIIKDSFKTRFRLVFPYWISFYAIYISYSIISSKITFSAFDLFCRPLIYGALIFILYSMNVMFGENEKLQYKAKIAFYVCSAIIALLFVALIETMWFLGFAWFWCYVLFIVYFALSIFLLIKTQGKEKNALI